VTFQCISDRASLTRGALRVREGALRVERAYATGRVASYYRLVEQKDIGTGMYVNLSFPGPMIRNVAVSPAASSPERIPSPRWYDKSPPYPAYRLGTLLTLSVAASVGCAA
jgi:hypothetical protein